MLWHVKAWCRQEEVDKKKRDMEKEKSINFNGKDKQNFSLLSNCCK